MSMKEMHDPGWTLNGFGFAKNANNSYAKFHFLQLNSDYMNEHMYT